MNDVTIIVPIYNVEKYIEKCLNGLLRQTYKNIEILAIDDGSPDNSKNIVREFEKRDSRIKLVSKDNGGYGSVLEYAIKQIKTKYFLICDPDDWLEDTAIEKLYNFSEKNNLDIAVADMFTVYKDSNSKVYTKLIDDRIHIKPKKVYEKNNQIFAFAGVSPHAKLYKTNIAKKIKFPHKISYTDNILYIMAIANAKRIAYLDLPLANYLIDRPGNTMANYKVSRLSDTIQVWESLYIQLSDINKNIDILWLFMYRLMRQLFKIYSNINLNKDQRKNYIKRIDKDLKLLQKQKKKMDSYIIGNLNGTVTDYRKIEQIFYIGVMNKFIYRTFVHIYMNLK